MNDRFNELEDQAERLEPRPANGWLDQYARELGVKASDLLLNLTENNPLDLIAQVESMDDIRYLKQTLVEPDYSGPMGEFKKITDVIKDSIGRDTLGLYTNRAFRGAYSEPHKKVKRRRYCDCRGNRVGPRIIGGECPDCGKKW